MDPFFLAASTKLVSCSRVAAAPVGLFGEQKKMMSDFSAYNTQMKCSAPVLAIAYKVDSQTASSVIRNAYKRCTCTAGLWHPTLICCILYSEIMSSTLSFSICIRILRCHRRLCLHSLADLAYAEQLLLWACLTALRLGGQVVQDHVPKRSFTTYAQTTRVCQF